jgi:hypothetical protein
MLRLVLILPLVGLAACSSLPASSVISTPVVTDGSRTLTYIKEACALPAVSSRLTVVCADPERVAGDAILAGKAVQMIIDIIKTVKL